MLQKKWKNSEDSFERFMHAAADLYKDSNENPCLNPTDFKENECE